MQKQEPAEKVYNWVKCLNVTRVYGRFGSIGNCELCHLDCFVSEDLYMSRENRGFHISNSCFP